MASWFDEQTQPPPYLSPDQLARVGITDPGQGPNRGSMAGLTSSGPAPSTTGQTATDASGRPYPTTGQTGQNGQLLPTPGTFLQGGNVVQPYQFSGGVPPPTAQTGGTTTTGGPQNGDYQGWFMSLVGNQPWNQQTFNSLVPQLQAAGIQITPPNANGDQTKIGIPDGQGGTQWVRVGFGEGHPVWIPQSGAAGGSDSTSTGGMADGSLLTPWTTPFTPRDPSQIAQDPAYQFQLGQGTQAINRSAAARGTLLTGGTLKSLDQYGQGLASTFNDKYYARDLGEYQLAQQNFYANQDRPFSKLSQLATLGKPTALPTPTVP